METPISPLAVDIAAIMEKHGVPLVGIFRAVELCREVARGPSYEDSDPAFLLATLQQRARDVVAIIDEGKEQ